MKAMKKEKDYFVLIVLLLTLGVAGIFIGIGLLEMGYSFGVALLLIGVACFGFGVKMIPKKRR